jgi:hypothetical protein
MHKTSIENCLGNRHGESAKIRCSFCESCEFPKSGPLEVLKYRRNEDRRRSDATRARDLALLSSHDASPGPRRLQGGVGSQDASSAPSVLPFVSLQETPMRPAAALWELCSFQRQVEDMLLHRWPTLCDSHGGPECSVPDAVTVAIPEAAQSDVRNHYRHQDG